MSLVWVLKIFTKQKNERNEKHLAVLTLPDLFSLLYIFAWAKLHSALLHPTTKSQKWTCSLLSSIVGSVGTRIWQGLCRIKNMITLVLLHWFLFCFFILCCKQKMVTCFQWDQCGFTVFPQVFTFVNSACMSYLLFPMMQGHVITF